MRHLREAYHRLKKQRDQLVYTCGVGVSLPLHELMSCSIVTDRSPVAEGSRQSNRAVDSQAEVPSTSDTYLDSQWALDKLQLSQVWQVTSGSPAILVAVLDTGIDRNHEDLAGKVVAEVNFSDSPVVADLHGHGRHIAGIIAANTDNGIGIAGVAPRSLLMNAKVADDYGRSDAAAIDDSGTVWPMTKSEQQSKAAVSKLVEVAWGRV